MRDESRKIFRQELFTLREEGYLSDAIVETVAKAHHQYHLDLLEIEAMPLPTVTAEPISVPVPPKPPKEKKALSSEEIRERNITWSLNIGVIFLLIGGLFVATSNWGSMTSIMKSGSIAIVSLLFYGIAGLTKKVLHIEKTAFAFNVLGSLFLPIFILSLGWFGLLGTYFSISGDGRYFLGMLGSLLPAVVYLFFAAKLRSRLFVWFTYVSISAGAAFLLAGINLKIDLFYLGMMVFNALLIFVYHQLKNRESLTLFMKEFVPYIQANLIISTLFMLFFYDSEVIYSFNLLLTAVIYLSMMYVSGRKEYHFIFSMMVVYGAYQLIEHSYLDNFSEVIYALIGFGFVFIPKVLGGKFTLDKAFEYTSAVISGFAFVYISLEGIMLRSGNPSIVLFLAYCVIAANFVYLSNSSSIWLFPYLSSAFAASAIYEAVAILFEPVESLHFSILLYLTGYILFIVLGVSLRIKYLRIIQSSTRDLALVLMGLAIVFAAACFKWWELGAMLLAFVIIAFLLIKKEPRQYYKEAALWILPSVLGLSLAAFGEEVNINSPVYFQEYGYAVNFAGASLFVLLSNLIWNKAGEKELAKKSFIISQVLYTMAIIFTYLSPINQLWVQPLLLLIGIGMYFYFYKKEGTKWIPFLVSIASLLAYFSITHAISEKISFNQMMQSVVAPTSAAILLFIALATRKKDKLLSNAFAWTGHIVYPVALCFTWFAYHTDSYISFFIALCAYALSTKLAGREWKVKVFLYSGFTSLLLLVSTGLDSFVTRYYENYELPITSILIYLFAAFSEESGKKRTAYYLVPFSILGAGITLATYPFGWIPYLITFGYALAVVAYLHLLKWDVIAIVPLFIAFLATAEFSYMSDLQLFEKMLLSGGLGVLMAVIGQTVYKKLFISDGKLEKIKIDGYTFVSFLYFWLMYFFQGQSLWSQALPGFLIAISIWMQRKRVPAQASAFLSILGGAFLLQPYYAVILELNIPSIWEMEIRVLPFIILIIFIRFILKERYSDITKLMQWAILIIVSLLLIQDGLASNTIYDAIILGSLSMLSMLSGMLLQIKSYFFVGAGVLLLNLFLQTRPYWGNMPWWFYLLIAGLVLITIASSNEWHKQKMQKGERTFLTILKEKVFDKIKQWD